jgi:hypothetical protein
MSLISDPLPNLGTYIYGQTMSQIQIIILAIVAAILFMTYLLIGLLLKIGESSKADHLKTMDELEKDRSFEL